MITLFKWQMRWLITQVILNIRRMLTLNNLSLVSSLKLNLSIIYFIQIYLTVFTNNLVWFIVLVFGECKSNDKLLILDWNSFTIKTKHL